jgi:hypothetical protein
MVWESSMGCFATGTFADIECFIGQGFMSLFGNGIMLSIFIMLMGVLISYKLKLPMDLSAIFIFSMVLVANMAFMPDWVMWITVLLLAMVTGFGFYKFMKSRG